ncbi:hypothetical protein [Zavarzinella formosa]|uniref:hypothetical protein n=1 Tax=Zavarzinella formosa TaxID=360055 RepID=UPI0012FA9C3E|nr:hypothetical protein [Zavarzinella formosa]
MMERSSDELASQVSPNTLLGYLNFSDGRPDPKFQRGVNTAFRYFIGQGESKPWEAFRQWMLAQAGQLEQSGAAAFRDLTQAKAIVGLAIEMVLPEYRQFHEDLLRHQSDERLFNSFFCVRVMEAVLAQGSPWTETRRISRGAVLQLNDYVGHRPIALLETRQQTEFYPHERLRPIPLYIRGAGVAAGSYERIIELALKILEDAPEEICREAWFNLKRLEELAVDPRAYDHGHPVNRRPNYLFGEWDPHLIDLKGYYSRFVVRQTVLDALLSRIGKPPASHEGLNNVTEAILFEASAVLAGTILMASGVCGAGPTTHDSDARLATLVPDVARYRDAFYTKLLQTVPGEHGELLRAEAKRLKQPFGGIRQHLNLELAKQRAGQLQNHELALILAQLGYSEASRFYASLIPTASARLLSEIAIRQTSAELAILHHDLHTAAKTLPDVEEMIHRGIECGALADPWNILGFQGLYPLFQSREDSSHDSRNEELIDALTRQFDIYARLLADTAAAGEAALQDQLTKNVQTLAEWWDQFAAYEVNDVTRLHGGERAEAALHVAKALAAWNRRLFTNEAGAKEDIAFWRDRRDGFNSSAAFAQVIEALLLQQDWRASLALLIAWLSESETASLEEGTVSFHELARQWLEGVMTTDDGPSLVARFFALVEANAETLWDVPEVPMGDGKSGGKQFASAYDEMSYEDTTDDGEDASVAGSKPATGDFPLETAADDLEQRLAFLSGIAELWRLTARVWPTEAAVTSTALSQKAVSGATPRQWLETARLWHEELQFFVHAIHEIEIPASVGGVDEMMEYDRRRMTRDHLTDVALDTCVQVGRAIRALQAIVPNAVNDEGTFDSGWEESAGILERAMAGNEVDTVRESLQELVQGLSAEPLLCVPLSEGGEPQPILKARTTLALLESLFEHFPPLGLIRETYHLVKLAKAMERNGPESGRRVSEFDRLFRIALRSVVDTLLDSAREWERDETAKIESLVEILRKIADSFLDIWVQHSQTLRLSAIEAVLDESEWGPFRNFVAKYGRELFTAHFLTYGNVRGLLHRGVGDWLDSLMEKDADHKPEKLLRDMEKGTLGRSTAVQYLEIVLHTIAEHYEEYRDYNTTTTWSDYGENLYVLLDFLRLKARYERYAWRMRPLVLAHEELCRKGLPEVAERWEKSIADFSKPLAAELIEKLAVKEAEHAVRLRTIRDRIEERFLRPLALDRLCALVEPAARDARNRVGPDSPAFHKLWEQLKPLAAHPIGVGLDVPQWLRKLHDEVERVQHEATLPPKPAEPVKLTFSQLQKQLEVWDEPLTGTA